MPQHPGAEGYSLLLAVRMPAQIDAASLQCVHRPEDLQAALLILLGSTDVNQIEATFLAICHRIAALMDRAPRVCYMGLLEHV